MELGGGGGGGGGMLERKLNNRARLPFFNIQWSRSSGGLPGILVV